MALFIVNFVDEGDDFCGLSDLVCPLRFGDGVWCWLGLASLLDFTFYAGDELAQLFASIFCFDEQPISCFEIQLLAVDSVLEMRGGFSGFSTAAKKAL